MEAADLLLVTLGMILLAVGGFLFFDLLGGETTSDMILGIFLILIGLCLLSVFVWTSRKNVARYDPRPWNPQIGICNTRYAGVNWEDITSHLAM